MKKQETIGQEFENFLESAVEPKRKVLTKEDLLNQLQQIADELNISLEDGKVFALWLKRNPTEEGLTHELCDEVIDPMYFKPEDMIPL